MKIEHMPTVLSATTVLVCAVAVGVMWINSERLKNELQASQDQLRAQTFTSDSLNDRRVILERVVSVDETIMSRYQKSVDACREATSAMIDGDYTSAMIHAKDVGETEEDVQPLIEERQQLLQGTNSELL